MTNGPSRRAAALTLMALVLSSCGVPRTAQPRAVQTSAGRATTPTGAPGDAPALPARLGYVPGLPQPTGPIAIGTVRMITPLRGWGTGPAGKGKEANWNAVLSTADAGRHWRNVTPPGIAGWVDKSVFFLDLRHAWVVVTPHIVAHPAPTLITIFRTADGAATWQRTSFPMSDGSPGQLYFVDAIHGWLLLYVDQGVAIYRTTDGGAAWGPISVSHYSGLGSPGWPTPPPGTLPLQYTFGPTRVSQAACGTYDFSLSFSTASSGWAAGRCQNAGAYFYATHDGGVSWQRRLLEGESSLEQNCPCEVSTTTPIFTTPRQGSFMLTVRSIGEICKSERGGTSCAGTQIPRAAVVYLTEDGGLTWVPHALPTSSGFDGPTFLTHGTGWFAGYAVAAGGSYPTFDRLYVTHDGGLTWSPLGQAKAGQLQMLDQRVGWGFDVSGDVAAGLLETADGGRTWQPIDTQLTG